VLPVFVPGFEPVLFLALLLMLEAALEGFVDGQLDVISVALAARIEKLHDWRV
jgi:hypothetical protein